MLDDAKIGTQATLTLEGGTAIADILYGNVNPSGRLCVTFHMAESDIPPLDDYEMNHGRTYMYGKKPLYPFGFGLSYKKYEYSDHGTFKVYTGGSLPCDRSIELVCTSCAEGKVVR